MEKLKDRKPAFLIDSSVLINIFEQKNEGKSGELLIKLKEMRDKGVNVKVVTPLSSFLRAIFLADSKVTIKDIQKTLSFLEVVPSTANFKDEKAVTKEIMELAKIMAGEPLDENKV